MGNKPLMIFIPLLFIAAVLGTYFFYNQYKLDNTKTEVMKDGRLRIVYPYSDGGFYFNFHITDEGVIQKSATTQVGQANDCKQGAVFSAAAEGRTDIYTVWTTDPVSKDYQAELFHVTVDSSLKISYKSERISVSDYVNVTGQDLFGFSR